MTKNSNRPVTQPATWLFRPRHSKNIPGTRLLSTWMDGTPCPVSISALLLRSIWFNRCSLRQGRQMRRHCRKEKPCTVSLLPPQEGLSQESQRERAAWVRNNQACLPAFPPSLPLSPPFPPSLPRPSFPSFREHENLVALAEASATPGDWRSPEKGLRGKSSQSEVSIGDSFAFRTLALEGWQRLVYGVGVLLDRDR